MSPESKSVKMVSLACLVIGIVSLAISVYVFATTSYELVFKCLFLAMLCAVVLGYCLLSHKAEDPLIVVTSVVCTVCSMVLAIVAAKAAKAIKSA